MARINGSGFKMKQSPVKGKLKDFFSSLGNQLKRNRKDIGGEFKGVKQKDKPGGFGSLTDKDKDGMSDFIQAPKKAPKGKEKVSSKPHTFTIGNRTYRKTQSEIIRKYEPDALFEYSLGPDDPDFSWRTHNPKDPKYQEIVEAHEKSLSPIEKKSPSKKRGYKMKRK